jgi:DeoR/GlpR family transcriptional regulator of sugar metabolism
MSLAGEERKNKILDLLSEKGKVKAGELSLRFDVTTETIRRDLDELEQENKLKKVYGGAIKVKAEIELPYYERQFMHSEAKSQIGLLAAGLIEDQDVIAIDEGSTTLQILHHLANKQNLTIMTCSISAMLLLVEYQKKGTFHGKIILIGGEVNSQHLRITGPIAENMMDNYFVNKAFISVDGISPNYGITSYDTDRAMFSRKLIKCSQQAIVVADSAKLSLRNVARIAGLNEIETIVCNEQPPEDWNDLLIAYGVTWLSS